MSLEKILNQFKQRYNYMFRGNKYIGLYAFISEGEYISLKDTVMINGQLCVHNDTYERYLQSEYFLCNQKSYKKHSREFDEADENGNRINPFKNHTIIHELCIIDEYYSSNDLIAKINLSNGGVVILSTKASATRLANLQLLLSSWTTEFINEQYRKVDIFKH